MPAAFDTPARSASIQSRFLHPACTSSRPYF
uniref:Uncharacterized protein n=1 Tax=Anguilla anguilla TaxID=7936 RepID=A0A0E9V0W1_ANGAN